jgi:hypothetical protein
LNFIEAKRKLLEYLAEIRIKLSNKYIDNNTEVKGAHIVKVVLVRLRIILLIILIGSWTS